jgi:hypothetical protein
MGVGLQARVGIIRIASWRKVNPSSSDTCCNGLQAIRGNDLDSVGWSAGSWDNTCPELDLKSAFWGMILLIEILSLTAYRRRMFVRFFQHANHTHASVMADRAFPQG